DLDWKITDQNYSISYDFIFNNRSYFALNYNYNYTYLFFSFDPTNSGGERLPVGSEFYTQGFSMNYNSDPRRLFNFSTSVRTEQYFNGNRNNASLGLTYRFQPYGQFSLVVDYNDIMLPEPYNSTTFWLVSPRLDVAFTRDIFLTTFFQYNQQADNINLNTRLQWRFKPVSDLFIVYSENYFPETLGSKTRALVLKISYWLNV
ncbi:MAG: hypothetical protein JJT94_09760, partial [Bernardetiaceae bacterium]|nr:hypothetical protein [Bernardetiaceae bacterium]